MVKAKRKPLEEIYEMIKGFKKILIVGCGGCTSVCLAGGQREVMALSDELNECFKAKAQHVEISQSTIERQCNPEYLPDIEDRVNDCDCIVSMACGAGVQFMAEAYPSKPVLPALNTMFVGIDRDIALFQERCRTCGDCQLGYTGGICPVTCCAKSLFNGPCGGTHVDGKCEVGIEVSCAWNDIYERLKAQNRLESILKIHPPMEWTDKGPGAFIQMGYEDRYKK